MQLPIERPKSMVKAIKASIVDSFSRFANKINNSFSNGGVQKIPPINKNQLGGSLKIFPKGSQLLRELLQVETVSVHYFCPGVYEIIHKFFFIIVLRIDLSIGSEDRIRAENQVNSGGSKFNIT